VGGDYWNYKTCKAPVRSSPPASQHPVLFAGRISFLSPNQQYQSIEGKKAGTVIYIKVSVVGCTVLVIFIGKMHSLFGKKLIPCMFGKLCGRLYTFNYVC